MSDYEPMDGACPHCHATQLNRSDCLNCGGSGHCEEDDDDGLLKPQLRTCRECKGIGATCSCGACHKDVEFSEIIGDGPQDEELT